MTVKYAIEKLIEIYNEYGDIPLKISFTDYKEHNYELDVNFISTILDKYAYIDIDSPIDEI